MLIVSTYLVLWKLGSNGPPPHASPEGLIGQVEAFVSILKRRVQEGNFKEIRSFVETGAGYAITGDISGDRLHEMPAEISSVEHNLTFEVHQVITRPTLQELEEELAEGKGLRRA